MGNFSIIIKKVVFMKKQRPHQDSRDEETGMGRHFCSDLTASKMSKYGVISGLYFLVFGLSTEIYGVNLRIQLNTGKYRPEKTLYLNTRSVSLYGKCKS